MIFTGIYELSIDPKNRLSIPADIRSRMDIKKDGTGFYLVPGDRQGLLSLYADKYFESYAEKYHSTLRPNQEKQDFEMVFYAMATFLDVDKQGRVLLPQRILDYTRISKQVTISGSRDHLVIWNRKEFSDYMKRNWSRYPDLLRQAQLLTDMSGSNGESNGG
ncbi:MAG: division/cell wall cluster transcriptional repressor MraZ [Planctomycetota bacterium]|jgi:MraZ protein